MAITVVAAGVGSDATNTTTYTTASVSFTAGKLYVIGCRNARTGATPDNPAISGATSGTWTNVAGKTYNPAAAAQRSRVQVKYFLASSTFSEAISLVTTNACLNMAWIIAEISGIDTGAAVPYATNAASDGGDAATSGTVALAAFGSSSNLSLGFFGVDHGTPAFTASGSFTLLDEVGVESESLGCVYQVGDADPAVTFTSGDWGGVGMEIAAATGGGGGGGGVPGIDLIRSVGVRTRRPSASCW